MVETTVRKNIFRGLTTCFSGGNNAQLFLTGGAGKYFSIQDNVANDSCGYWLLGYGAQYTVIEDNDITGNIPLPISPKDDILNWTIRGNHIKGQTTSGAVYIQEYGYTSDIEICYNLIHMSGSNGIALKITFI